MDNYNTYTIYNYRVLKINDIDDYIKYGGLMNKGKKFVNDYESVCKYLDSAVS